MSALINKSCVKKYILGKLKSMRPFLGITRVSQDAMIRYESRLQNMIIEDIKAHPAVGKTFKP